MKSDVWKGIDIYKLIFDNSPEAIVLLDKKGLFIQANTRLYDWIGYKPEDVVGKNMLTMPFFGVKTKIIVGANFAKRMLGKQILPYEIEFVAKNGDIRVGRIIGTPIRDTSGEIIGDLVMISEITELKKIEHTLYEKVEELGRLNTLMIDRELKMVEMKKKIKLLK